MRPIFLAALSLLLATPALAAEGEHAGGGHPAEPVAHEEHDAIEHRIVVALLGSYQAGFSHGEVHHLGGGGLGLEAVVVPGWFEMELVARGMKTDHGVAIPVDLLFMVPFHATREIHPFIAIGPTVTIYREDEDVSASFGGALVGGVHFWFTDHVGCLTEVFYVAADHDGLVHEVGVNAGLVFGF